MKQEIITIFQAHRQVCCNEGKGLCELALAGTGKGTFVEFCEYYEMHYRPLLEQLAKDKPETAARFIVEDMDSIFLNYLKEYEES